MDVGVVVLGGPKNATTALASIEILPITLAEATYRRRPPLLSPAALSLLLGSGLFL